MNRDDALDLLRKLHAAIPPTAREEGGIMVLRMTEAEWQKLCEVSAEVSAYLRANTPVTP